MQADTIHEGVGSTRRLTYLADCKESEQKESIRWKDMWLAPPKLENTLAEEQDQLLEVNIGAGNENRLIYVSRVLPHEQRDQQVKLLTEFKECFAREYHELPGLDQKLMEHRLSIKEGLKSHKQPAWRMKVRIVTKIKKEIK